VIDRLLTGLLKDAEPDEFDVLLVSNGSTDDTARIARQHGGVRVLELSEPSKHLALIAGDREASGFPRVYVDADIEIDTSGVRALVSALAVPGVLAVAPERDLVLDGSSPIVRAYYRVWSALPAVRHGLFGRGVIAVSEAGFTRIADRPLLLGDDLFVHSQFSDGERRIVTGSRSKIRVPRTVSDLIRRRIRAAQGNVELAARSDGRSDTSASSARQLLHLAHTRPALWPSLPVFVAVTVVARLRARQMRRQGQSHAWLRDESSRD
jgi:glycosyltransferase involved in cell wall biosynthesis